jgi:precorrin-6A synthase
MIELSLVGIGSGSPEHITLQGIKALNAADVILIPRKSQGKSDLAELRESICAAVLTNRSTRIVHFDMPLRDSADADYVAAVNRWHDAIADIWFEKIRQHLLRDENKIEKTKETLTGKLALLVWGDPSLYDSTLRIAERLKLRLDLRVSVVPGITALQALTAAHAIALNDINAPVTITTGRQLREHGWPAGADTLAVMLDGECSFRALDPTDIQIWWGAYLAMPEQILVAGRLSEVSEQIATKRKTARAAHGWIMDMYLLRRVGLGRM